MTSPKFRVVGLLAAAAIAIASCGNAVVTPTPSPTVAPTPTQIPTPILTPAPTPVPTPTPTPAPTQLIVATVPVDQLVAAGQLTVCSDLQRAPQAFLDAAGDPTGSDVDLANEIANRLGIKLAIQNTLSKAVLAALTGRKCDIVMSGQRITPLLLTQVNTIPYFHAGQAFIVARGNVTAIATVYDLCGKTVGVRKGTIEADHLNGAGTYNSAMGLNARCQAARKTAIAVRTYTKDSDAILAIEAGKLTAYFTDSPAAGLAVMAQPDQIEVVSGLLLEDATQAISVTKGRTDLDAAVWNALQSMIDDGTYLQILKKYGVDSGAITAAGLIPD